MKESFSNLLNFGESDMTFSIDTITYTVRTQPENIDPPLKPKKLKKQQEMKNYKA